MTYISQLEEKVFLSANLSAGVSICLRIDRIIESLFVECVILLCCNIITQPDGFGFIGKFPIPVLLCGFSLPILWSYFLLPCVDREGNKL
jgi:hypothetical protein